jgi:hypothetical protein
LNLEHSDLLAECEDFQGGVGPCSKENTEGKQDSEQELGHELTVVTCRQRSIARPGGIAM